MTDNWIKGACPMGCGPTLRRREFDDRVVCQHAMCPRPTAVSDLLEDREIEHVVHFTDSGFTIRHPLKERLEDAVFRCRLPKELGDLEGPPVPPGRYRTVYSTMQGGYLYEYVGTLEGS